MIEAGSIKEILGVYVKHGWTLRRVLLSDGLKSSLGPLAKELFGDAPIRISPLDAFWFSRPSTGTIVAWELRHLSNAPYALLEGIDDTADENDREAILNELESRMRNTLNRKKLARFFG